MGGANPTLMVICACDEAGIRERSNASISQRAQRNNCMGRASCAFVPALPWESTYPGGDWARTLRRKTTPSQFFELLNSAQEDFRGSTPLRATNSKPGIQQRRKPHPQVVSSRRKQTGGWGFQKASWVSFPGR